MKGFGWLAVLVLALMFIGCFDIGSALGRSAPSGMKDKTSDAQKAAAVVGALGGARDGRDSGGGPGVVAAGTGKPAGIVAP